MADAVKRIWPDAKLTIGPPIDTGFYYDFDIDHHFTDEDLGKLESLCESLEAAFSTGRFRRTLAGALVSLQRGRVMVERAPPRRHRSRS